MEGLLESLATWQDIERDEELAAQTKRDEEEVAARVGDHILEGLGKMEGYNLAIENWELIIVEVEKDSPIPLGAYSKFRYSTETFTAEFGHSKARLQYDRMQKHVRFKLKQALPILLSSWEMERDLPESYRRLKRGLSRFRKLIDETLETFDKTVNGSEVRAYLDKACRAISAQISKSKTNGRPIEENLYKVILPIVQHFYYEGLYRFGWVSWNDLRKDLTKTLQTSAPIS